MIRSLTLLIVLLGAGAARAQSAGELDFLHGLNDFKELRRMLPRWLEAKAADCLAVRRKEVAGIADVEALRRRQQYVRSRMIDTLGGFPERTPLNARVTGTLERDGYRIEKIIFESQPKFFVTANLYLPAGGPGPFPAVLFPLGHEPGGKSYIDWQQILVTLARRGYVALTWDPVGQGERVQFYDPDWQDSKFHSSVTEHTELGIQCLLNGDHIARYTVWDGIRALDYLLSRPEVDPKRIACTGNSGGGTHTAYISALDDRIQVAAPSCYINSWDRMLAGLGPQDAEQVFPNWLKNGLDYPDFIYAFGPKPFAILSAIRDFFPILGARETFAEVKGTLSRLGLADRIEMVEADDGHGYSAPRRAAGYEWLGRWLKQSPDREPETAIQPETAGELACTATGQVSTSVGGDDVFTLNRRRSAALRAARSRVAGPEAVIERARLRSGFAPITAAVAVQPFGTISRPGYRIEKLTYESEPGILIPALLYLPENGPAKKPALLFADGAGKSASRDAQEQFVRAGFVVLSIDARGFGETRPVSDDEGGDFARYFGDYEDGMTAMLVGRTLPGLRAEDIVRGLDLLAARKDVDRDRISGYGKGAGAVPLLYAAAFDRRLGRVALDRMLVSYESVVNRRIHRQAFEQIVPGALRDFDLPDLVAALAPRPVWLVNTVDPLGERLPVSEVRRAYRGPQAQVRVSATRLEDEPAAVYREMQKF